jgi:hypothetical protein
LTYHATTYDYDSNGLRTGQCCVGIGERPYFDPASNSMSEAEGEEYMEPAKGFHYLLINFFLPIHLLSLLLSIRAGILEIYVILRLLSWHYAWISMGFHLICDDHGC